MISKLLNEKPMKLLPQYIADYKSLFDIDEEKALEYIKTNERFRQLTSEWYEKLNADDMDAAYRVYDDEYYFTDVWNCFVQYSRRYLRDISRSCLADGESFLYKTRDAKIVLDVGCGIGYTTAILTQLYPYSRVYGTNLKNTKQWTFCEMMAKRYGFSMIESAAEIGNNVDIVFASEYFEHFYDPVDHLGTIVDTVSPKYFVIGNAFNTHSIGHFIKYKVHNQIVDQADIALIFNNSLRNMGYTQLDSELYNNKPNIWQKNVNMLFGKSYDKS